MLQELLKDITNKENSLILAKPKELDSKRNYYNIKYATGLSNEFKKDLLKVFNYSNYKGWGAYKLANELNVKVCPYCNRSYIFTISSDKERSVRPEFDHFFNKATYPYLALCFYNLVPSCHICNANLKGKMPFNPTEFLHPYDAGFDERVKFSIKPSTVHFLNGNSTDYELKFKANKKKPSTFSQLKPIVNNISAFQLKKLYALHKDYVDEIIQKAQVYSQDYYEELFDRYEGTLFNDINDVKRMVLSNYITQEDLGKRVLAKLTKDIAEELGLLK